MEKLNSAASKTIFKNISCIVFTLSDDRRKKSMTGGGRNKKRYQYCSDSSGTFVYFRALQGHSGRSLIDPILQDNVIKKSIFWSVSGGTPLGPLFFFSSSFSCALKNFFSCFFFFAFFIFFYFHFLSFSFIVFHFLKCSVIFFHFLSFSQMFFHSVSFCFIFSCFSCFLSGAQNLIFFWPQFRYDFS